MFEVRVHGRGGQGVVTAAEMLSVAAFVAGRHAVALPSFGSERMGAPVVAFCRIDDRPIRSHDPVMAPDALVIQDVTLLHHVDVFAGLSPDGYLLINTSLSFDQLGVSELTSRYPADRVMAVPATEMAQRLTGRPMANAALLGGLAALTGIVPLPAVAAAIRRRFPGATGEANVAAATEAAAYVDAERGALRRA